ncbi:hypothetical protein HD553DRAFT_324390 [Filobasidium floriforme]|uniref:uncharacterized protein n=1 Tax=Filobasidium floriforme TaxID=5210 RepID=UPI001E8DB3AC|nr:uncharacterized protein HD553DRAFT_325239 [Filobasidium floriforme]XP_046036437.1 uncharacterized protein HD553DRAFT_324390 [Filobasidium floriforme]KAH8081758.1 hypothetical protein HD553DRAFT_325239 [Filobasidium floriforme]KAH8084293.1 hypothetical protein HD553DRAFT_324390 [Filobasidium floriforme]
MTTQYIPLQQYLAKMQLSDGTSDRFSAQTPKPWEYRVVGSTQVRQGDLGDGSTHIAQHSEYPWSYSAGASQTATDVTAWHGQSPDPSWYGPSQALSLGGDRMTGYAPIYGDQVMISDFSQGTWQSMGPTSMHGQPSMSSALNGPLPWTPGLAPDLDFAHSTCPVAEEIYHKGTTQLGGVMASPVDRPETKPGSMPGKSVRKPRGRSTGRIAQSCDALRHLVLAVANVVLVSLGNTRLG